MKVKVKKHKKLPVSVVALQVISSMAKSGPDLYSVLQKAIRDKDSIERNDLNDNR